METFWYIALSLMMIMYVILDGFDIGAGIIHLNAAKTDIERRNVLGSIGPVWDGNEVWLIAAGGTLFFAFPAFYASVFSGFYLPLIIVLWLLIGRALGIELRRHIDNPLWKSFWDAIFFVSSLLLAVFYGAALGNLIRGVPLQDGGVFFEPLWTNFSPYGITGILDWFTVLMGLVSLSTLVSHGANFIALRNEGEIQVRSRRISKAFSYVVMALSVLAVISAISIRPQLLDNFSISPFGCIFPLGAFAGFLGMVYFRYKANDMFAFISSSVFIASALAATAFALYPHLLYSSINPKSNLTIFNSKTGDYAMSIGMIWWIPGIVIAAGYFIYLFRSFGGKMTPTSEDESY